MSYFEWPLKTGFTALEMNETLNLCIFAGFTLCTFSVVVIAKMNYIMQLKAFIFINGFNSFYIDLSILIYCVIGIEVY